MSPRPRRRSRVDGVLLPVALVLLALLLPGTTASPTKLVESLIDSNPKDLRDNRLQSEGGHPQHGLDDELLLVHVVFRHGDRTPDSPTYPNDPYGNFSYSPVGWGNLTPAGKRTEYRFGKFLRRRYDDFLGDYANGLVAVRSTDWARTKDSMALVLAGLFPPSKQQSWAGGVADDDNLLGSMWSPIAAESVPRREDKLLYVLDVPCPAYDKAFKEALQSPAFQKKFRGGQNAELISYLEKHSGAKINTPEDVYNIYQALLAQQGFGLTLPSWTTEVYPDKIKSLTSMYFDLDTYTRKMQRLRAGPLLKQSLQWSLARSNHSLQPANRKMYLYSAHDNNVAALLKALQVWESSVPPYGVAVIMEVKSRAGQIGVQLYLRNSTLPEVHPLTMPNCDNFCPLHKFVDLTSDVVPEDWDAECQEDTTVRSVETASAVTSTELPDL